MAKLLEKTLIPAYKIDECPKCGPGHQLRLEVFCNYYGYSNHALVKECPYCLWNEIDGAQMCGDKTIQEKTETQ